MLRLTPKYKYRDRVFNENQSETAVFLSKVLFQRLQFFKAAYFGKERVYLGNVIFKSLLPFITSANSEGA